MIEDNKKTIAFEEIRLYDMTGDWDHMTISSFVYQRVTVIMITL